MVKRKNLAFILIAVIIILGIMFLLSFSNEFKQVVQGLAPSVPADTCSEYCTGVQPNLAPGGCVADGAPVGCPADDTQGTCGILTDICSTCGCVTGDCQPDGSCVVNGNVINNDGGDGTSSCSDPDGDGISDDCGSSRVCIDGRCEESICGDLVCDYRDETCEDCFEDCENGIGLLGGCEVDNQICEEHPIHNGIGVCQDQEAQTICEDGTPPGECSATIPLYCTADLILEEDCTGGDGIFGNDDDCGCPGEETCNELTGICYMPDALSICGNEICDADETCGSCPEDCGECLESPMADNICDYVGGICQEECQGGYYPLNEEEYPDLIEDCREENSNSQCCYPFENDDLNDCTYYGGSCLASCGDDSYYAEIDYLDDECEYYEGSGTICCIPYAQQEKEDIGDIVESNLIDSIFGSEGGKESSYDSVQYSAGEIRLSESLSLNREILFVVVIALIIIALVIFNKLPKIKKK